MIIYNGRHGEQQEAIKINGLNKNVNITWTGEFEEIKANDINIDSLISFTYPFFHLNKKARTGNNFAHPLTYFSSYLGNNNTSLIYGTEIKDFTYWLEGDIVSGHLHIPQENTVEAENITNVNDNTIRFFQNFTSFEEMEERTNLFQFFNLNEYAIGYKNKNPIISNKPSFSLIHSNNVSMDKNLFGYDQVIIKSEEYKENGFDLTEEEAATAKEKMENLAYYDKEDVSVTDQSLFKYEYLYDEDENVVSAIIAGFNDGITEPDTLVIPHHISYASEDENYTNDAVEVVGIKDWAFGFKTCEDYNNALCSGESASGGFRVVYIPNTVKYIGNMAFANRYTEASNGLYYGMEKIKLSKKLSYIGLDAFYGCQLLHEKNYQTDYVIGNEEDIWFNKEKTILIKYPKIKDDKSYNIPDTVTEIADFAFYGCNNLTNIIIPKSVSKIGQYAFSNCTGLSNVYYYGNGKEWDNIAIFDGNSCLTDKITTVINDEIWERFNTYCTHDDSGTIISCDKTIVGEIVLPDIINGERITGIGDSAFWFCTSLTSVTIPNSVTNIGDSAFYNCTSLTSITIPDSVTNIGYEAFSCCDSLTSVTIPNSVTSIKQDAFSSCINIEKITMGEKVTHIGNYAFSNCTGLTQIEWNAKNVGDFSQGNHIFEYAGQNGNGINVIFGDNVERIPAYCFRPHHIDTYLPKITSVTIGNSVKSIGRCGFYDCGNLENITIPDSVTSIEDFAFYSCDNLEVIYYNGTKKEWKNISIGSSNEALTNATIYFTNDDTDENYNELLDYITYNIINGEVRITDCDTSVNGDIIIPDMIDGCPVTSIGNSAFRGCTGLTSVIIPDSVTYITMDAFYGCNSLVELTMPKAIYTTTGPGTRFGAIFGYAESFFTNPIPENTTDQGYSEPFLNGSTNTCYYYIPASLKKVTITSGEITEKAFYNCNNIKEIILGNGVTSIGKSAFYNCTSLTSIVIPDSVTSIGISAFSNTGIVNITIPYSIIFMGESAFESCTKLKNVMLLGGSNNSAHNNEEKYIEDYVFTNCINLKSVTLSNNIVRINSSAFYACSSLTQICYFGTDDDWNKITIEGQNEPLDKATKIFIDYEINNNEVTITGCRDNTNLKELDIPSAIKGCPVTSIGDYAFYTCRNLTSISIPNSVKSIEYMAFSCCFGLTRITIPNSVTSIEDFAFYSCTSLTSITIPDSVTRIDSCAFYDCTSLKSVHITDISSWCNIDFYDYPSNPLSNAKNLYLNNKLVTDLVIPDGVTEIKDYAFFNCTGLTSITLPDSVTNIKSNAFRGCDSLTSITIPDSITSIGWSAFSSCGSLTSVKISKSVTSIGNWAFYECCSLKDVIIGNSVKSIGEDAFYNIGENAKIQYWGHKDDWDKYSIYGNYEIICILDDPWYYKVNLEDFSILDCGMCKEDVYWTIYQNNNKYILQIFGNGTASDWTELNSSIRKNDISCFEECYLSCTNIELGEFIEDIYIKKYVVHDDSQQYSSDDDGVLYSKDKSILYRYPVDINKGFYQIGDNNSTEQIIISDSVKIVEKNAFNNLFEQILKKYDGFGQTNIKIKGNNINIKDDTLKSSRKFLPDMVWINYSFNNNGNVACHVLNYLKTNYDNLQDFEIYNGDCFYYSFTPYIVEMNNGKCNTALYCGISAPNQFAKATIYINPVIEEETGNPNIALETIFNATNIYGLFKDNNNPIELNRENYQIDFDEYSDGKKYVTIKINGMNEAPEILLFSFPYNKFKTPNYCIEKIEGYFDVNNKEGEVLENNVVEEVLKKHVDTLEKISISNEKELETNQIKFVYGLTETTNEAIITKNVSEEEFGGCYILVDFDEEIDISITTSNHKIYTMTLNNRRANLFIEDYISDINFIFKNSYEAVELKDRIILMLYKNKQNNQIMTDTP